MIVKNECGNDLAESCHGDKSPGNISIFVSFDDPKFPVHIKQFVDDFYQDTDSECSGIDDSDNESGDSDSVVYSAYLISSASTVYSAKSNHLDDSMASSDSSAVATVATSAYSYASDASVASAESSTYSASSTSSTSNSGSNCSNNGTISVDMSK